MTYILKNALLQVYLILKIYILIYNNQQLHDIQVLVRINSNEQ